MVNLKDRNQKDLAQYNIEYKELMRQLDQDAALKKFLLEKAQERSELAKTCEIKRKENFEAKSERKAAVVLKVKHINRLNSGIENRHNFKGFHPRKVDG